ncbi:acetyl-CoA carboxylase biotin carboxyl carrier protein subunit [Endomicrobiia bacterium]|nr:acetyl-CoA carboxylase biotin carboxyl carrier protein subunit [Endomicrobiia bacterium]GHT12933.1 acetyl-CoA carboxylase biotin carboxyl carrier protein subunit [Endomicrobiia bacterium]GHT18534.1 acetyl-CoA carboxylase biotin carboxyl carrier protein subunit [Endomicrobiia bacterium]GHT28685.1 acetyl-CoA carboxylase biotin carboxyl carrier protein subunit [Endomicrobiia bacterium]GHT30771.1 acetyl-CoA carboxylase biotin carboxyl carrier protein subunit [Endomicrobiia bacterium]
MVNDIKDEVRSLYEIMKEEKVQELEINSRNYSICIKRKDHDENNQTVQKKQIIVQEEPMVSGETIKTPIAGVFYRSPSPSYPVFVNEGDIVNIGKTVCIIEAMKVMNEIKATFKAKILKMLAENGKPVNSGQDLFEVEKV